MLIKEMISGRENTCPQNMYEMYAAGALGIACIGLQCVVRYAHRAASRRLLPEATTGLGGSGLWNVSITAGKDFLENDDADEVLTKGTKWKQNTHTWPVIYLDARKLELMWNIHCKICITQKWLSNSIHQ